MALGATGRTYDVFEQARQLSEVGAGLGLQQNAQRVLVLLDLGPEMTRIGSQLKGFRGAPAEARPNLRLGAFDHSVAASSAFGPTPGPRPPREGRMTNLPALTRGRYTMAVK